MQELREQRFTLVLLVVPDNFGQLVVGDIEEVIERDLLLHLVPPSRGSQEAGEDLPLGASLGVQWTRGMAGTGVGASAGV